MNKQASGFPGGLRGNELWQLALLELWLQRHGITGPAA